jgi:hypothetical protein
VPVAAGEDAFSAYDALIQCSPRSDPWRHERGEPPEYGPESALLESLLTVPIAAGAAVESGRFARGIDAWLAHELRRCGFAPDEVWPRAERPRVLPRDVAVLLDSLPKVLADEVRRRVAKLPAIAPTDARFLGRAYDKQVDVCIARWDRGPELLVSTKAQLSSFGKNLPNRFEEAYGDAANLRARYPLAAVGFLFVQRATIVDEEPEAYERTLDMIRKLRELAGAGAAGGAGYTATGLILVDWTQGEPVRIRHDLVPEELSVAQFMIALVDHVLAVTPVHYHVEVRKRRERREIPVEETGTRLDAGLGHGQSGGADAGQSGLGNAWREATASIEDAAESAPPQAETLPF